MFKLLFLSMVISISLFACETTDKNSPSDTGSERTETVSSPSTTQIPNETVPTIEIEGQDYFYGQIPPFNHNWYAGVLRAMEEEPLIDDGNLQFRFLWLRTFDEPYVVRGFIGDDAKLKLMMKYTDGTAGYDPGELHGDLLAQLTPTQTKEMIATLEILDICNREPKPLNGTDGSQWVFEIYQNGGYCVVDHWLPEKDGAYGDYYKFGIKLLQTTGVKTWEMDVY